MKNRLKIKKYSNEVGTTAQGLPNASATGKPAGAKSAPVIFYFTGPPRLGWDIPSKSTANNYEQPAASLSSLQVTIGDPAYVACLLTSFSCWI